MGQNIGTCVTALISAIGASKNAKRAAMIHLYFNLIGVTIILTAFYVLHSVFSFDFLNDMATASGIAVFHSLFNVTVTILLFPFLNQLVKLASLTIRDKDETDTDANEPDVLALLDERFLNQPAVAVQQGHKVLLSMAHMSMESIRLALQLFSSYNSEDIQKVEKLENETDKIEDVLGAYLVKTSEHELSERDSERVSLYLQNIGDLERIADHSLNLVHSFTEMHDKGIRFSRQAESEIGIIIKAVNEVTAITEKAIATGSFEELSDVEPLEQVIDNLTKTVREHHITRLRDGSCTMELGYILADITTNLERVSDHCSNLASGWIMAETGGYDTHQYMTEYRRLDNEAFRQRFTKMSLKYNL